MFRTKVKPFLHAVQMVKKRDEYIDNATVHGLNRACNSKKSERWFWVLMMLVVVGILIVGVCNLVERYLTREVALDIREIIHEELEFPSVTICNNNRISYNYQPGFLVNDDLYTAFSSSFHQYVKDFPSFCSSNEKLCNFTEDFISYGENSPCITWNFDGKFKQILPGKTFGVQLIIYLNDTVAESDDWLESSVLPNAITVVTHFANEYPSVIFDGLEITPGVQTRIEIQKKMYTRLPAPHPSGCQQDTKFMDTENQYRYTRTSCIEFCFIRYGLKQCSEVIQPRYAALVPQWMLRKYRRNATYEELYECHAEVTKSFHEMAGEICDCPLACTEVIYLRRIHTVPLNVGYIRLLNGLMKRHNVSVGTCEKFRNSIFYLDVYYPRLGYELVSEKAAYSITDIFSDFGGQLGLALGASALSIVELMIIMILSVHSKLKK